MFANSHEIHKEVNSQFLTAYPHYVLPSVNLNNSMDLSDCGMEETSETFPYSCSLPVPSMPVHVLAAQHDDPALTLVKEKLQWKYDVKLQTDYLIKAKKVQHLEKLLKDAKKKGTAAFQPRELEFVKLFFNNPDEHFDGVYNWYYTGGCMSKLELDGTTVIVLSQGKKMDQVCTLSSKNGKKWQMGSDIFTAESPSPNSPVFELCCKNIHGNGIIGIRVRNGCCIYSMTSLGRVELLHRTASSYPFTSLDVCKHLKGRYCTVTTEREINVWDAVSDSQIFSMTVPFPQKSFPDKWNCICWSNSRCLVMADRYYIQMVDVRKKDVVDLFSPRKDSRLLHECEMITLIRPSAISPTAVYVTTSHQVLLYDIRSSSKPLQQWTHLLRAPPLYGSSVVTEDGKEAACFANQQLGEISMILNSGGEEQSFIEHPVAALPNIKDALRAAHRHRLWLDPTSQQRLKLSWTGMTWLPPHKSKLTLLTINSAGDVFSQVLNLKKEDQGLLLTCLNILINEDTTGDIFMGPPDVSVETDEDSGNENEDSTSLLSILIQLAEIIKAQIVNGTSAVQVPLGPSFLTEAFSRFASVLITDKYLGGNLNEEHRGSFSEGIVINDYSTKDLKCLKNWEKHTIKRERQFTLKATRRIKMNHVFKSLKNSSFILSKPEGCVTDSEDASQWKMSKAEMLRYKDVMAPVLLQTWEIDDENEWHADKDKSPEAVPENTPTATQKVEAWLNVSLQSSSDLAKNTSILAGAVKRKSNRTVMSNTMQSSEINEYPHSFSKVQNETVSQHLGEEDSEYTPMPHSASSAMTYRTPNVCSHISASSTPWTKHSLVSQDLLSSQLYSSQSQAECLLSSQNSVLSTSKPRTVRKSKHTSGF